MATSVFTKDYMGRALQNANPGTTNPVKDFLGRNTTTTADFVGRGLTEEHEESSSSSSSS